MFVELMPLAKTTMIQMLISVEGDDMRVIVMPKAVEGQNPALCAPLSVLASPAELDEKLPGVLAGYVTSRQSLEDSLENVKLVMEQAKREEQAKATEKSSKATAKTATKATPAPATSSEDVDFSDDEPFEDEPTPVVTSSAAKSEAHECDLFG